MTQRLHIYAFLALAPLALLTAGCTHCNGPEPEAQSQQDTIPMLVMQIQKCSRLYTTEYKVRKIVTYDDVVRLKGSAFGQNYNFGLPLGDRKVAIPMEATLKAYIDMGQLSENDIVRTADGRITITLPNPHVELTSSKIDQEHIREYVALTRAHFSDKELLDFEQQGREAIVQSIPQLGIIDQARQSAARLLIPLIEQMGYREQDVTIVFPDSFNPNNLQLLLDQNALEK
ncbi:MAG: DUF4230 domain-containing protein [Prevotella sp.]|nr:DUF4230 domain-containing protein [Prevotella sp.]